MDLKSFTRGMVKEAGFMRWLTTSKIRPHWFGSQAKPAKELISSVGGKLSREEKDRLHHIAGGGEHPDARKIVREASKKHDARKFSVTKPAILGAGAIGGYVGLSKAKQEKYPNLRLPDRSPQLTQDPSRYLVS